jgi:hypothetical protein
MRKGKWETGCLRESKHIFFFPHLCVNNFVFLSSTNWIVWCFSNYLHYDREPNGRKIFFLLRTTLQASGVFFSWTTYKKEVVLSERWNNFASNALTVSIYRNVLKIRPDPSLLKISKNKMIVWFGFRVHLMWTFRMISLFVDVTAWNNQKWSSRRIFKIPYFLECHDDIHFFCLSLLISPLTTYIIYFTVNSTLTSFKDLIILNKRT